MADNSRSILLFHDMAEYWRIRAEDYIKNYMEDDDAPDGVEDPIYAKLRFCDMIERYLASNISEKPVEEIISDLYENVPEGERTDFFIDYFVEYAINLGELDYECNNDRSKSLEEKIRTTVMYGMIKEMVSFIDEKYGQYGMEILEDEVPADDLTGEVETYTFDYFDKKYDELAKNINTKRGNGGYQTYELICHLVAVIDSFSEEDKKKAGKERNEKFQSIIDYWKEVSEFMNKEIDSVFQNFSEKFIKDIKKLDK